MPQVPPNHYFRKKYVTLERFISYFHQVDLLKSAVAGAGATILEVGVGNRLLSGYLRSAGMVVTTCDADPSLGPDHVADVRRLPFADRSFDVAMAFEVLEHLPFEDLPRALGELGRVSRGSVLLSLPVRASAFELVLKFPFIRTLLRRPFLDLCLRIPLPYRRPSAQAQHFWEIDLFRYPLGKIRQILGERFTIVREVRPVLHHYHRFFVLRKREP